MPESVSYTIGDKSDFGEFWDTLTITASHTVGVGNTVILANATSGALTVTLPLAGENVNRVVNVKKIDSSSNTVTIDGNGSETIDGSATQVIVTQDVSITMVSDGSSWRII